LYPTHDLFYEVVKSSNWNSKEKVVRLWLTEGIPYIFRDCPSIYEELRSWLGERLQIYAKEITLVGSARIGFSLATIKYGRSYSEKSDLDLCAISNELFNEFSVIFEKWKNDYINGRVNPLNETERRYWNSNLTIGEDNLNRGFFDVNKLPTRDAYPTVQFIQNTMWILIEKLKVTPKICCPKRASIRVYKSWDVLIKRNTINLKSLIKS
jgi:hypothetical protein